jgi:hypothetical protein
VLLFLSKALIVFSVVGLLRCSGNFRRMSRELDEQVFKTVKRLMHATEESGYPPQLIPLLMLLTAACFMLSAYITAAGVR